MNISSFTDTTLEWTARHTIQSIFFGAIIIGTIVGNCLALIAFITHKKELRSPTHIFLANLALADLLVGILSLPFLATFSVTLRWYFGQPFCAIWTICHFWFCSSSILSTLAVCVERFIGVRYPLKHLRFMNKRAIYQTVVGVWIVSGILSAVPLLVWPETPSEIPYDCKINFRTGHVVVASVGIFHIPATAMVILYWLIYRMVVSPVKVLGKGSINRGGNDVEDQYKKQVKLARKLAFLVGFLIISYLPMFTVFLILGFKPDFCSLEFFILLAWIRYLNSCVNPVIYAFSVPGYRQVLQKMLCGDVRSRNDTGFSSSSSSNSNSRGRYGSVKTIVSNVTRSGNN